MHRTHPLLSSFNLFKIPTVDLPAAEILLAAPTLAAHQREAPGLHVPLAAALTTAEVLQNHTDLVFLPQLV